MSGCPLCGVGALDECSDTCPSRYPQPPTAREVTMKPHEWRDVIRTAANLAAEHEQRLRRLCLNALADGVPATLVADAAGVNRTTLWRWQQEVTS